jgi:hypothetical protein
LLLINDIVDGNFMFQSNINELHDWSFFAHGGCWCSLKISHSKHAPTMNYPGIFQHWEIWKILKYKSSVLWNHLFNLSKMKWQRVAKSIFLFREEKAISRYVHTYKERKNGAWKEILLFNVDVCMYIR